MRARTTVLVAGLALAATLPAGAWALAATAGPEPTPGLPELPSVAEQVEGLYDPEGCLVTGPGEVDCSVRAEEVDEALSHGPATETRHLEGFVGSHWLGQVSGNGPTVVDSSIQLGAGAAFTATGLARNEGDTTVDRLEVTGVLLDAAGTELATVTSTSLVHDVRPGEPVPFTVRADVPAASVAEVAWSAAATGPGDDSTRAFAWTPYWERPAGGQPVDLYLHRDGAGPRPHLLFGSASSVAADGSDPVSAPEVVVAWLTAEGRVAAVHSTPLRAPDGGALEALGAGAAADALLLTDADPPAGGEVLVWVQGS